MLKRRSWDAVAVGMGFVGMLLQLVLVRELFCLFSGNEMVMGIVMGGWMLWVGVGVSLGKWLGKDGVGKTIGLFILEIVFAMTVLWGIQTFRHVVLSGGSVPGMIQTVLWCLVFLLPCCVTGGLLLAEVCRGMGKICGKQESIVSRVYGLDCLGSMLGGCAFVFANRLSSLGILWISLGTAFVLSAVLAWAYRYWKGLVGWGCLGVICIGVWNLKDVQSYLGRKIVWQGQSAYGKLIVTKWGKQYEFIYNGKSMFATGNVEQREENVHYAMAQRTKARNVLVIGGGVAGIVREVLKYPVDRVDYVELDSMIFQAAKDCLPHFLQDKKVRWIRDDGRFFVKQTTDRYDVVLSGVGDPTVFQSNRFYTKEFFEECKKILVKDGVVGFGIGEYHDYVGEELGEVIGLLKNTVGSVFKNVRLIPGGRVYFLCSDGDLGIDISKKLESAGIKNYFVKESYLKEILKQDRIRDVEMDRDVRGINGDMKPIVVYRYLNYWLRRFGGGSHGVWGMAVLVCAGLLVYLSRLRKDEIGIFTAGFVSSGLEIVGLMMFQVMYGVVYRWLSIMLGLFMLGLALGCFTAMRYAGKIRMGSVLIFLGIYGVAFPWLLEWVKAGEFSLGWGIVSFGIGVSIPAFLCGSVFGLVENKSRRAVEEKASKFFRADYLGGVAGVLSLNTLLIPLMGLWSVCLWMGMLCILCGLCIRKM